MMWRKADHLNESCLRWFYENYGEFILILIVLTQVSILLRQKVRCLFKIHSQDSPRLWLQLSVGIRTHTHTGENVTGRGRFLNDNFPQVLGKVNPGHDVFLHPWNACLASMENVIPNEGKINADNVRRQLGQFDEMLRDIPIDDWSFYKFYKQSLGFLVCTFWVCFALCAI